ncbi:hypothetical protein [Streptomyces sp. NPDC055794]
MTSDDRLGARAAVGGVDAVTALLRSLRDGFESGERAPSDAERTCAAHLLRTPGPPDEVILDGLRLAGPDVAPEGGTFAIALVHSAGYLRSASTAESPSGRRLVALLHEAMSSTVRAARG